MRSKFLFIIVLLCVLFVPRGVWAANYEFNELIPKGITTTIRGKNFLYKNFVYQDGFIRFESIKNISDEARPLSISIGLFGEDKRNIGTINYCLDSESDISSKQTLTNYMIEVKGSFLASSKSVRDIQYIVIFSENDNCTKEASLEFVGKNMDEILTPSKSAFTDDAVLLLRIVMVVVIVLVALFVYNFVFTTAYQNMDGTDVRQEYAYINKELRKEREYKERHTKPVVKEVKTHKTKEIIEQEKKEKKNENKSNSQLHQFYDNKR